MTPCSMRQAVDRHFAGRIRPDAERELREHLASCDECRRYYDRHLLLAKLDPEAPSAQERLARGLGVSPPRGNPWAVGALGLAAAATAIMIFLAPRLEPPSAFTARGGGGPDLPPVSLTVFQVENGASRPVVAAIAPGAELAFAYENRAGRARLLVFGVDEHRHVYWFFPAWQDPKASPEAMPIARTETPREIKEAVRHAFDGARLEVRAIFTDEAALTAPEVERRLAAGAPVSPGGLERTIVLEIARPDGAAP